MNDIIVSKLENALSIKFEKEKSKNSCYISSRSSYLSLFNVHFENFLALEPVFETVETLILTECSIADAKDLHQMKRLESLTMKKCSISMKETFDPDVPKAETTIGNFHSINMEDMDVPHPGFFLPVSKYLYNITFTGCTVGNIHELNLFPKLHNLTIENSNFIESSDDIKYQRETEGILTFLTFDNMKLKNFDFFIPVSKETTALRLYNCELESLKSICQFPRLERLYLDPDIKINDLDIPDDNVPKFKLKECILQSMIPYYDWDQDSEKPDFNTELLLSIAPYVQSLTIEGYTLINTHCLKYFSRLKKLRFDKCSIDLEDYVSIASQIKQIYFDTSEIKNQYAFRYFTKLKKITVSVNRPEDRNLIDLKKLLPLKESLKKIILLDTEVIQNLDRITNFTTLERLVISVESIEFAQEILSMESLKDLELIISIDKQAPKITESIVLDLQHLKNVEKLQLYTNEDFYFKGIGHLKSLKMLILEDDGDLETLATLPSLEKLYIRVNTMNQLPRLEQVKVLNLYSRGEECELNLLDKFPNIEKLDLTTSEKQKIKINDLEKLKILMLSGSDFDGIVSLENLPHLEELEISNTSLSKISKLENLINLKVLNLEENQIENIEGLENLKNLERLNLYDNEVSDISVLNKLPKLREANLAGNKINKEDAERQLDKTEVAIWYYRPYTPFRIIVD